MGLFMRAFVRKRERERETFGRWSVYAIAICLLLILAEIEMCWGRVEQFFRMLVAHLTFFIPSNSIIHQLDWIDNNVYHMAHATSR